MLNTKPNRDITAEEPTTSTEWEENLDKLDLADLESKGSTISLGEFMAEDNVDIIKDFIRNLLTTRTDELLGAMKMEKRGTLIDHSKPYATTYSPRPKDWVDKGYCEAVDEFNKKLATLKDKYEK